MKKSIERKPKMAENRKEAEPRPNGVKMQNKMKAIICTKYGLPEVFQIKEVEKSSPKNDEVCIKIYAAGVTAIDIFIRSSKMPLSWMIPMRIMLGIRKPRSPILGLYWRE